MYANLDWCRFTSGVFLYTKTFTYQQKCETLRIWVRLGLNKWPEFTLLQVFAEVFRVLRPGGVFIVSFSNRLFYEKAISAWRDGTAYSRVQLVVQYFQCVEGFTQPETIRKLPATNGAQEDKGPLIWIARLLGFLSGSDPFYAVIAYKNFKPLYEWLLSHLLLG